MSVEWVTPLFDLQLGEKEIRAVTDVLRSNWISMGEVTATLENEFATLLGANHAIAVASGTAALHLALRSLEIGAGDEVICPSLSFVATANAILYVGATPVFADILSDEDLTISPNSIEALITPRTRAIVVMHYGGYPCMMQEICKLAQKHNLFLVEDAAHSPLGEYNSTKLGTIGHIGCFSFFSNKNLTTAEGGMIVTNDEKFATRVRRLRSHGMTSLSYDRFQGHAFSYDVVELGYNYRMDDIRAALGRAQLRKLPRWNKQRQAIVERYRSAFRNLTGLTVPFARISRGRSSYHLFPVLLRRADERPALMDFLRQRGVQTSIHYPPIHHFDIYRRRYPDLHLPVTEEVASREVTLPLYPTATQKQIDCVVEAIQDACKAVVTGKQTTLSGKN